MNSWIKWTGGECPVPKETLVQIKFKSGHITPIRQAGDWDWKHRESQYHGIIIAYRINHG